MRQVATKHIKGTILPQLEKGRPNFDLPHTLAVVAKLKAIIQNCPNRDIDEDVLTIVAYLHDWGYTELYKNGKPIVDNPKIAHMEVGARKSKELLENEAFNFLTSAQKDEIVHLVSVHDFVDRLRTPNELTFLEADTLGALDTSLVKPTFDKSHNDKYIKSVITNRLPKFINNYSKEEALRLIAERQKFYDHS